LLSEALARLGAQVVGVDASPGNVAAARLHAQSQNVTVDYRLGEPAMVMSAQERFDVVLALEVVEHVSDLPVFLATTAARRHAVCLHNRPHLQELCSCHHRSRILAAGSAARYPPVVDVCTSRRVEFIFGRLRFEDK